MAQSGTLNELSGRIRKIERQTDATEKVLREIAELQQTLRAPSAKPHFYALSGSMVEEGKADRELLEAALKDPYAPSSNRYLVSLAKAQRVIVHLRAMWSLLEDAPSNRLLPFMQVLLLSKQLQCIDQLRPADKDEEGQPAVSWQVLELNALLVQVAAHEVMWNYMLRWPFHCFDSGSWQLIDRAATYYARAAMAAAPDAAQQARFVTGAVSRRAVLESACRRRSGMEPLFLLMPPILSRCVCDTHHSFSIFYS